MEISNKIKTCIKCNAKLSFLLFSKNKKKKDGHENECKPCAAKRYKEWSSKNMGLIVENHKRFRQREKEKFISKLASIPEISLPDIDYE